MYKMNGISIVMCLTVLVLLNNSGLSVGENMRITSFTADIPTLVIPGSTLSLHCNVTAMDPSRFVQLGKLLPSDQSVKVVFSTNTNVEQSIRNIERYQVTATQHSTPGAAEAQATIGFDFVLKINDVRLEDAGMYFCSIPSLGQTEYVEANVFAEPQRIELYVDDVRVADRTHVTFESSATHEIRCEAKGSYPQAVFQFTLGGAGVSDPSRDPQRDLFGPSDDENIDRGYEDKKFADSHTMTHEVTTLPLPSYPEFFAHTTFTTKATVKDAFIDFLSAGRLITCTARIPGWPGAKSLSTSFTPVFTGWAPEFSCRRYVMASPADHNVTVKCIVYAKPIASEVYVYYFSATSPSAPPEAEPQDNTIDGSNKDSSSSSNGQANPLSTIHNIYPTRSRRPASGGPEGVLPGRRDRGVQGEESEGRQSPQENSVNPQYEYYDFEADADDDKVKNENKTRDGSSSSGKYKVTVNQRDSDSTSIELTVDVGSEDTYRDYYFVASNKYGTSLHVVTLLQDPAYAAVQSTGSEPLIHSRGAFLMAVTTSSISTLLYFVQRRLITDCTRTD